MKNQIPKDAPIASKPFLGCKMMLDGIENTINGTVTVDPATREIIINFNEENGKYNGRIKLDGF